MAPARPPQPGKETPILAQQGAILVFFVAVCFILLGFVCLGDLRSRLPIRTKQSQRSEDNHDDPDTSPKAQHYSVKRRDAKATETTPLLSSESTLIGSETESPTPKSTTSSNESQSCSSSPTSSMSESNLESTGSSATLSEPVSTVRRDSG